MKFKIFLTATFDEALKLEKMYSSYNDSNSFRAAEAKKQLKRAHPINENSNFKSGLIDLNSMISEIDSSVGQGNHVNYLPNNVLRI